ncbi:MAG: prepilin-type N-terminal cleavage/methylation domain-containing protein [Verrucomicrobia bacterium]|nr:prepilin-type N-terminal cleavage/methylation domain-containing protein [Verrucomicrobiota bacterium]MDA1067014.1 prepilin-type N-terminal cleavage/methylation domain-containing protein [Verrucomicrobiota bacterium]
MTVCKSKVRLSNKGFTLVEMITVITIIGILAALLFPTITSYLRRGQRTQSLNSLKQISGAYFQYRSDNNGRNLPLRISKNPASGQDAVFEINSVYHIAYEFAWRGYLNDGTVYQIPTDLHVEQQGAFPQSVAERDSTDAPWIITQSFSNAPISFDLVAGLSSNAPSSTPVALTRGLDPQTGEWSSDESVSPYGADGGHIAFLDGHVEWFNNISGELTNPITRKPANSILQSISQGAQFFGDPDKSLLEGKEGVSGN